MSALDHEWQQWRQDWNAAAPPSPSLLEAVRRGTRKQRLSAMVLVVAGLAAMTYGGVVVARDPDPLVIAGLIAAALACAVVVVFYFRYRVGTWRARASTTKDFVALSLARCHAEARYVRLERRVALGAACFIAAYGPLRVMSGLDCLPTMVVKLVVATGVIAAALLYCRRESARLGADRDRLQQIAASLAESEDQERVPAGR